MHFFMMFVAVFIVYYVITPWLVALGVVRLAQRRARAEQVAARDAARRYGRWFAIPWLVYGVNVLVAGTLFASPSSAFAPALHRPLGSVVALSVALLPILLIALVVRSWPVALGHPAGRLRIGVTVRAWLVQVTVLLVSLDCLAALLQYEGPIAAAVGAVVLVASNIATSQDLFRWIWRATPLGDDARARRLRALLVSAGVKVRRILIIPASIGVAPNAFVSGVLDGRRYLFIAERLLDELPVDEVEAVVAHEIGHLVRRHVARLGIAGVGILAVAAAVLNGILALAAAWGMSDWLRGPLIGLIGAAAPLTALYVTRRMSRRFEFEADEYAAQAVGSPRPADRRKRLPPRRASRQSRVIVSDNLAHGTPNTLTVATLSTVRPSDCKYNSCSM